LVIKARPANGTVGYLIRTAMDTIVFRVYSNAPHDFVDYDIRHYDMRVQIKDADAHFYTTATGDYIDHSPETLGHTR
jgi:hypothetical protein